MSVSQTWPLRTGCAGSHGSAAAEDVGNRTLNFAPVRGAATYVYVGSSKKRDTSFSVIDGSTRRAAPRLKWDI